MRFDLTPTAAQHDLARRTHEFAESVIRPVALDYDQRQEFPWPVLEEAAQRGFYNLLFYRELIWAAFCQVGRVKRRPQPSLGPPLR